MSVVAVALVAAAVVLIMVIAASGDEKPQVADDPIAAFLNLADNASELPATAIRRVMPLGTRVVGPIFERLRAAEAEPIAPAVQIGLERIVSDFGVAGVNALVHDLTHVPRRHVAVPAVVRIIEGVGAPVLPKLSRERRVPLELRVLLLRRFVARGHPVWDAATDDDDSHLFVAASVRRAFDPEGLPLDLLRACASLPGERGRFVDVLLRTGPDTELPLDRFDRGERNPHDDLHCLLDPLLRDSEAARARGWLAAEQPSRRGADHWFRWAASRANDVPVREALVEVASRRAESAVAALCAVGQHNGALVAEIMRNRRADGWTVHHGDWLRAALRRGGMDAERVALERLNRGPLSEAALVGSAFADLDVANHLDLLLSGFYRATGRAAVELETLIDAGGESVTEGVRGRFDSDERRVRRGSFEIAGRLGWGVTDPLLDAAVQRPLDAPYIVPAVELLAAPTHAGDRVSLLPDDVRRAHEVAAMARR